MSVKNNVIIYARVSKSNDPKCMSLNSQEHACAEFAERNGFGIFKILKDIGSAFSKPQTDLKNVLRSCKNKLVVVFEPSRLSRNTTNFRIIYKICEKNKHSIAIVTFNTIFDYRIKSNYKLLFDLITQAQQESIDLGRRISRSYQYKKSKELPWGKKRTEMGVVDNDFEFKISHLIHLLNTEGSLIEEIRNLINIVGKTDGKEPFEIIEYTRNGVCNDWSSETLPYPMSPKNIFETLRIYEVPRRQRKWNREDVVNILSSTESTNYENIIDNLMDIDIDTTLAPIQREWIIIWYDPLVGLPPNIVIPEGMTLPTNACSIYIPK